VRRSWLARCVAGLVAVSAGSAAAQTPAKPSYAEACLAANRNLSLGISLPRTAARLEAEHALAARVEKGPLASCKRPS
jgi:hypothetical protein